MAQPESQRSSRPRAVPYRALLAAMPLLAAIACPPQSPAQNPAQTPSTAPASIPAGLEPAKPPVPTTTTTTLPPSVSPKQAREADDAYIQGVKDVAHNDFPAAEKNFARAVRLNPNSRDYALALAVARQHRLTELVHASAKARLLGENAHADALLEQARAIDPNNPIVAQHFGLTPPTPTRYNEYPFATVAASLSSGVQLAPLPGTHDIHMQGPPQDLLRRVYQLYGVDAILDPSVPPGRVFQLDLPHATFLDATRVIDQVAHVFAVPLQPKQVLLALNDQEHRDQLLPQFEQTIELPGLSTEQMTDLANLARNIFDLKSVTASTSSGTIVVRGDSENLRALDITLADMLGGGSDVLLDIDFYEVDRTRTRNIGPQLPSSFGAFSVLGEAQQLITANESTLEQAIAANLITLTGNTFTDLITEAGFLVESGLASGVQFTNLIGTVGNGLSLAGVYLGSGASFNLLLNSSDVRILDAMQIRAGDRQDATLRAGERYPIITSTYTSGLSSSVASAVAGLNIQGSSAASLLQQYLGSYSVTVPQIQFEDLGLTLKATPQIQRDRSVSLKLDLKIESLGAASIDDIPILNNRQLTSSVTVPAGATALLASQVNSTESKAIQGLPGLNDIPGFQGTTVNAENDSSELLITITPHVVRDNALHIVSRPISVPHSSRSSSGEENAPESQPPQPAPPRVRPEARTPEGEPAAQTPANQNPAPETPAAPAPQTPATDSNGFSPLPPPPASTLETPTAPQQNAAPTTSSPSTTEPQTTPPQ